MGGLPRPPRPRRRARLSAYCSEVRWIARLEEAPVGADGAVVWLVRPDGEAAARALRTVRPRAEDLADAARWRDPEHGAARLARRLLLRALAAAVLGAPCDAVEAARDARGRPLIAAPCPLHASIARSAGWAAVAVAPHPVGVDLEHARPAAPLPLDLLEPAERLQVLDARCDDARAERFARLWTSREAYLKATGEGLSDPGAVAARLTPDGGARVEGAAGAARVETRRIDDLLACAVVLA